MKLNRTLSFCSLLLCVFLFSAAQCKKAKLPECHQDRKTTKTIKSTDGVISQQGKNFIIIVEKEQKHYAPCNLPDGWKVDKKAIRFSGLEKEIYPHERWTGLPFVISEIEVP